MSISLVKQQSISLKKTIEGELTEIHLGLGWDAVKNNSFWGSLFGSSNTIDLDASCLLLDSKCSIVDTVWFRQLISKCGSVIHSGDNLTGGDDDDDESISVNLVNLPSSVEYLAFTVNSFSGQPFSKVENAYIRLLDKDDREVAFCDLSERGEHTAIFFASLSRDNGLWSFKIHGNTCRGSLFKDVLPTIKRELLR